MIKRAVARLAVVAGAAIASTICVPALAHAHHAELTPLPVAYSLGENFSVPCSGQLTGTVHTPHDGPGQVTVSVSWLPFFTGQCHNAIFVNYWPAAEENGQGSGNRLILLPFTSRAFEPLTGDITFPMPSGGGSMTVAPNAVSTTYLDPLANTVRFAVA
ncbi:hypothetical protein QM797_13150 [Rhodococcus sp. IEGM 1381]|uniref:hypothetical protein n=1 Tax=Rhodococcus sp. IEGM 1381 TaxID=3047085 RepID=UPI0024B6B99F|nr:hypothetical protein [Rhodococcus sp. IEGM 1381]MDI9895666.1 hypothetical protein [Rhodococcus sp. IEGM 1381]